MYIRSKDLSREVIMVTHSKKYENGIILLFFLTWGFLFIDRLAISFIFPVIVPDVYKRQSNGCRMEIPRWD